MVKVKTAPIQVQKYLKGIDYPASKEDPIKQARKNKATDDVISKTSRRIRIIILPYNPSPS